MKQFYIRSEFILKQTHKCEHDSFRENIVEKAREENTEKEEEHKSRDKKIN